MIYATVGPLKDRDPDKFLKDFFAKLKKLHVKHPYDVIDHHWLVTSADMSRKDRYHLLDSEFATIRGAAKKAGFGDAPFEVLEAGTPFEDEVTQARDIVKLHVYALARGAKRILWSGIAAEPDNGREAAPHAAAFKQYVIINAEGGKMLAYYSYKKMVQLLDGVDLATIKLTSPGDTLYVCDMKKQGRSVWVLWNDGKSKQTVELPLPVGAHKVKITTMTPHAQQGSEMGPFENAFDSVDAEAKNGVVSIVTDASPLFVEVVGHE